MRRTSLATRILMLLVCLGVAAYFGYQSLRYMKDPFTTAAAYGCTVDETVSASGYVVRSERVLEDNDSGLLRLARAEGERVSVGGTVAAVYADQASLDRQSEIDALEVRIEQLEYVQSASLSYEASAKLDNQIAQDLLAVRTALTAGRLDTVERRGSELRALVMKRDYTYSGGSLDEQLESLRQELKDLRRQSAGSTRRISAPVSGLYSAVVDGYETVLTPESILEMSPSQLSAVQPDSAVSSHVGKLILGDNWYYAAALRASEIREIQEAGSVSLRFSKDVARDLDVSVQSGVSGEVRSVPADAAAPAERGDHPEHHDRHPGSPGGAAGGTPHRHRPGRQQDGGPDHRRVLRGGREGRLQAGGGAVQRGGLRAGPARLLE